ncbi:MAG: alpha/beta hydrolase [Rhizobiaceae bacterium]
MKISQTDIIMVPGYTNSCSDHWQSRWEAKMKSARRVSQEDWHKPVVEDWTANLISAIDEAEKPVVLITHSLGCQVAVQAVQQMSDAQTGKILGAFMVAPPDVENPKLRPKHLMTFGPYPRTPLPFPSLVIASTDDPFCSPNVAQDMAKVWGSEFVSANENGHINSESGHGPWPDGLMVFANFMKDL